MKQENEIRVMLTCCNIHVKDIMGCFDGDWSHVVKVYVTNSVEWELPPEDSCEGRFVVPTLDDPEFIPAMLDICRENEIDVIFPISSIDLEIMSKHKDDFEAIGTKVSILPYDKLTVANNKAELHKRFSDIMPDEISTHYIDDALAFLSSHRKVCCKLADMCGGKGFAVVDDEKCLDVSLFHRFGKKHYISKDQLLKIIQRRDHEVLLQEYHEGLDYTVSLLADHGRVTHMVGYVGYLLEFGSIMFGEIKDNENAFRIAERLVKELELDGNIGIDFILKDDGSVVLLEINPRINASLPFVAKAGCNMAYLRMLQLMGEDVSNLPCSVEQGLKMKKYFGTRYFV